MGESRSRGTNPRAKGTNPRAIRMTEEYINSKRHTRAQLAEWGIPWPPPKGWKRKLLGGKPKASAKRRYSPHADHKEYLKYTWCTDACLPTDHMHFECPVCETAWPFVPKSVAEKAQHAIS